VIAATHKDLYELVEKEAFRQDLYFRINVLPLEIPSLKERPEDILLLLDHFSQGSCLMTDQVKAFLVAYPWKGNIREIKNVASYLSFMNSECVSIDDLPPYMLRASKIEESSEKYSAVFNRVMVSLYTQRKWAGRLSILKACHELGGQETEGDIRRYLEELETEKRLKRVYGGAVKVAYDMGEPEHLKRTILYANEKKCIGEIAASLVKDNETIVVDEGTTNLQLIKNLMGKKNLTIITSSYPALSDLIRYENEGIFDGEIVFIGGKMNTKHLRTSGAIAVHMMSQFFVDKAFISTEGILNDFGISSYDPDKALLSKKYIENSKETIVLCDHSKIGVRNFYKIADLKDVDIIISNVEAPKDWDKRLEEVGTRWITRK
jgi:DeoR/GlpR family transcriptional regulator of sugar metabolism